MAIVQKRLEQEMASKGVCFCGIDRKDADRLCTERDCPFKSPRRC